MYDEEDSDSYTSTSDSEKDENGGDGSSVVVSYEQHIVIDPSVASNSSAAPYQGKFRKSTRRPLPSVINMEAIQEEEEEAETNSLGSAKRGDGKNSKVNQNRAAASPGDQRGEGDKSITSSARRDVGSEGGGGGEGDVDDRLSMKSPLHHHPSGDDQVIDISIEKADAEKSIQFEATLVSERNKRVLLARLTDIMPRGRLSLVRETAHNTHRLSNRKPDSLPHGSNLRLICVLFASDQSISSKFGPCGCPSFSSRDCRKPYAFSSQAQLQLTR